MFSYELRQRKDMKVRVSTLVILFILPFGAQLSVTVWVWRLTQPWDQARWWKKRSKTFRVFFTNQSYYPAPIHTVSPILWGKKKKITLLWTNYVLMLTKITWGGDNWKNLGEGTERSRSISQNTIEQVVQTVGPVVYFIVWHALEFFFFPHTASSWNNFSYFSQNHDS